MKKTLLFAACVLLVMASCKKDENSNSYENKAECAMDPVVESIIKFDEHVKGYQNNTMTRNAETFTLEEAKDNIVNLFNATYGEPMESYTSLVTDEFSISIAVDANGNVSSAEAVRAYLQMVEKARKGYKASNLPNRGYKYILVDKVRQTRGDSVTIDLKGRFGTKDISGFHYDGPFEEGDCWHYIDGMGGCHENTSVISGADEELEKVIYARYMGEKPINSANYIIVPVDIIDNEFDGTDQLYGSYVFYRDDINETCICWQEMNDLLWGEYKVIYELIPQDNNFILKVNLNNVDDDVIYSNLYYVTNIYISGNNMDEDNYLTHKTIVDYSKYIQIGSGEIGQLPLD